MAQFKRVSNRLSSTIRFIAKKNCYHKEKIYQTQISLLFPYFFDVQTEQYNDKAR